MEKTSRPFLHISGFRPWLVLSLPPADCSTRTSFPSSDFSFLLFLSVGDEDCGAAEGESLWASMDLRVMVDPVLESEKAQNPVCGNRNGNESFSAAAVDSKRLLFTVAPWRLMTTQEDLPSNGCFSPSVTCVSPVCRWESSLPELIFSHPACKRLHFRGCRLSVRTNWTLKLS